MNILSAVVYSRPENAAIVQAQLETYSGVEVHGGVSEGKLVVTVEGKSDDALTDTMGKFNDVDGVINTVMIYHCDDENLD
jgi:periplasmic nitrate reductase NapD